MSKNHPLFITALEKSDPELYKAVSGLFDLSMAPGGLDAKTKVLIALAIDAFSGSAEGVRSLAAAARGMGITEGQISEAVRIAYMISGNKTLAAIHEASGRA